MDPDTWSRVQRIFAEACDLPQAERAAFLDGACDANSAIRTEIEDMLASSGDEHALGIERLIETDAIAPDSERLVGQRLGAWRIERLLGRGGMAEVWLAARDDGQYEQLAALKLLRPGWRTAELARRFRQERQVLARLRHPNISRLLDGGVTEAGLPFIAMEYVDGVPITEWCRERDLSFTQRLELFRTVCDAVHEAHANLIVHRDLKPSNILVTSEGQPILLDFGIAKLLDSEGGEEPGTREADRLLTPEYSPPEQLRGESVSTQVDVWGLGVLLYELLTGVHPHRIERASPEEIARRLEQQDGPAPASSVAPPAFRSALQGDLDRIIGKALRPDRAERYRSVDELTQDLSRWSQCLPVSVQSATLRYRAGRFVRRNRLALGIGTAVAVSVFGFGTLALWQAQRASAERDVAQLEHERSERVIGLLVDLFQASNPTIVPGGDTLRVTDFLAASEAKLATLSDQPGVQSRLWETMAAIHEARSRYHEERAALDLALGAADHGGSRAELLRLRHRRAVNVARLDGPAVALPLLRESLTAHESLLGAAHADVAAALRDLAEAVPDPPERLTMLERSLAILRAPAKLDSISMARTYNSLGIHHWTAHEIPLAAESFAAALQMMSSEFGAEHPYRLALMNNLSTCMIPLGRFEEAGALHRKILAAVRRVLGEGSVAVARSLQNLGVLAAHGGRYDESLGHLRAALAIYEQRLGRDHAETGNAARNLGLVLKRTTQQREADRMLDRAVRVISSQANPDSLTLLHFGAQRAAIALPAARDPSPSIRHAVDRLGAAGPPARLSLADALMALGAASLEAAGASRAAEAESSFALAAAIYRGAGLIEYPGLAQAVCGLSVARAASGASFDRAEALAALERCQRWGLRYPSITERAARLLVTNR